MNLCRLCQGVDRQDRWNKAIFETKNFLVLPSLGALVEGWLLIVPKNHYICVGALPSELSEEFSELKQYVRDMLQSIYGAAIFFEHGPYRQSCDVGCGVDHAHLHVLPAPAEGNLTALTLEYLPDGVSWSLASEDDCRKAFLSEREYLYFEDQTGLSHIAIGEGFVSQTFRRVIAKLKQKDDEYNWRQHPQIENVDSTIERVTAWVEEQRGRWQSQRRKIAA